MKTRPRWCPRTDPFNGLTLTPSMRAVAKYLGVVVALFVVQVLLGALTAHYTVEGQSFFGIPMANVLPYSLTRTWHIQTAMFWIATAFLAAGLFLAPAVGGAEPKYQALGVNVLFGALLVVVAGSLAGEYLAIHQQAAARPELLVRPSGLRVRRPWPRVADRVVHRPAVVAGADAARLVAGTVTARPKRARWCGCSRSRRRRSG